MRRVDRASCRSGRPTSSARWPAATLSAYWSALAPVMVGLRRVARERVGMVLAGRVARRGRS